jgi:alpha-amylase/alpha-mannosidase (GH57 family)/AraC-like DNA-binding protein
MSRSICIHGHFYQPPRENPWLEEIEMQDSAFPYHDWNERISAECYEPNAASRILDPEKRIVGIVNNYSKISFNFGPTLLSWMKGHKQDVYEAILAADEESLNHFSGHGAAIAQVYNHIIMPLANRRDKITQVKWGLKDFEYRFGRKPESMWLPETAVDMGTLEILAGEGLSFVILSPFQAARMRKIGEAKWNDVKGGCINTRMPYLCKLLSEKTINIFFYDGPISHDLSFGKLLTDGKGFADRLIGSFSEGDPGLQIVHTATDGETYGHHHRFGDMALAFCLHYIKSNSLADITIYGEFLEKHPPSHEVEIIENTSWSCAHGVDRWWKNCGCNSGKHPGWSQEWRTPFRNAMDWLREKLAPIFENELSSLMKDPWRARDEYIQIILDRSSTGVEVYFQSHALRDLSRDEKIKALKLLEMQRHALLMYTSCGWFFDELSGIETTQVIQYAARAIQLAEEVSGASLEPEYVKMLSQARSNIPELENGARIYELYVKPAQIDLLRVGAHYAISSLFEEYPEKTQIYCYTADSVKYDKTALGKLKLAIGQTRITSNILGNESLISFAILHLGDHNLNGGVREFMDEEAFAIMEADIREVFSKGDVPEVIRTMDEHFGMNSYSLRDLFRDEQRKVLRQILEPHVEQIETALLQTYSSYYPIMQVMNDLNFPLPEAFSITGQFVVNTKLLDLLEKEETDLDEITKTIDELKRFSFSVNKDKVGYVAGKKVTALMERLMKNPEDTDLIEGIGALLKSVRNLPVEIELWRSQNIFFDICKTYRGGISERAQKGDKNAKRWLDRFDELGNYLKVRCA